MVEEEDTSGWGEKNVVNAQTQLFAPTFRKIEQSKEGAVDEVEVGGDVEDISDEAVLARHTEVLAKMREKIDIIKQARGRGRGGGNLSFGGIPGGAIAAMNRSNNL